MRTTPPFPMLLAPARTGNLRPARLAHAVADCLSRLSALARHSARGVLSHPRLSAATLHDIGLFRITSPYVEPGSHGRKDYWL